MSKVACSTWIFALGRRTRNLHTMSKAAEIPSPANADAPAISIPDLAPLSVTGTKSAEGAAAETRALAPAPTTQPEPAWPAPYYFENGLRRVAPYHYTYKTWCKERWRGRKVLDVFESEFRDRPLSYYKHAIETGQVCVDGKAVSPDYVLENGNLLSHTIHRHEPPVSAAAIGILHEDDDMIVLNKPSGIPVHPAGRYNYNSIIEIMKAERGPEWIAHTCNRLDRLTSGIMFIAKTPNLPKSSESRSKNGLSARSTSPESLAISPMEKSSATNLSFESPPNSV